MAEIDFEGEGLLDGLEGRAREGRLELLRELADRGIPLDELREAVAENRLALLPVELVLGGGERRYTAAEVAERAGLDLGFLKRQRKARSGMALVDDDHPPTASATSRPPSGSAPCARRAFPTRGSSRSRACSG